jgi:hypothetical protein
MIFILCMLIEQCLIPVRQYCMNGLLLVVIDLSCRRYQSSTRYFFDNRGSEVTNARRRKDTVVCLEIAR